MVNWYIRFNFGEFGYYCFVLYWKRVFNEKVAIFSSCLLALSGLYLSTGAFGLNDFILTVLILIAFAFYLKKKYLFYFTSISLAVLTKETAIFFVISVLLVDFFLKRKRTALHIIPFIVFFCWLGVLHFTGEPLWNSYNFSKTNSHGSIYTMLYNLITFGFFNRFAYENWLHLFVFNYNWIYSLFVLVSFLFIKESKRKKEFAIIGIFSFLFIVLVLGFQTWTITRYVLPLLPFLYLFAMYGAFKLRFTPLWIAIIFLTSFLSLTQSSDPVSKHLWMHIDVLNKGFL